MTEYAIVRFGEVAEKIAECLPLHKDAVYGAAKLDWQQYLAASDAGVCWAAIAVNDSKLVGYSVYLTGRNMNHRDITYADNTGFFVRPEYSGIGVRLLKEAHKMLYRLGVNEISYALADERVEKLIKRLKPQQTFRMYSFHE